ncbi:MAG: DUF885 family protein [Phenylobacterium sp.]|uniref:DUF885 domain-containing protein n=1 Tax=Phenylobacterium sp. TaxID=1871053 RepID=UPI001A4A9E68|nr:DUF885 family protein [Phenylobacterium sp.]MBL8771732.1 DUF885 family protein [Phenylobacterium sp.]
MRRLLFVLALAFAVPAFTPALAEDRPLDRLVADYEAYALGQDPVTAGREGDRGALARLPDASLAADLQRRAAYEAFQARLSAVDPAGLSPEARLNREFLAWTLDRRLKSLAFDEARMPFNSDSGFDIEMNYYASTTPLDSEADAEAWIARLRALPGYYAQNIENARRGVRTGFTQPATTGEAVLKRARAAAAAPVETDPLLKPFAAAKLPPARAAELRAAAEAVIRDRIRPAQRRFAEFLEREYLPASRKGLGARTLAGGEAYYRWLVADHTTTAMTPDQIHELGLAEVARIRARMEEVKAEAGFQGDLSAFIRFLRTDPRFYARTREELLEKTAWFDKRVDDQMPRWFGRLPRLPFGVRPVPAEIEEGYTSARYFEGAPKQGVAGGHIVNTSHLDQRPLFEMPALAAHEAQPGHHTQIALAQELEGVPAFRRNAGVTAFTEGWGLYAERLAGEMGLYRNPYETFGMLSMEMWRACRLVADTGIHWKGWTVAQAKTCFTDNTALAPLNIDVELARYVGWPGQALAYKVGQMKILELRERARGRLGDRFDIRRFHDAVLLAGPLPLGLLEQRIEAWTAAEAAR